MTVRELIKKLESMPQDVHVYAEGEPADKVIFEKSPDGTDGIVRIFKAWDVEFVGRGIDPQESEDKEYAECIDIFKEWALSRKRG
jgi:hypothetical protein